MKIRVDVNLLLLDLINNERIEKNMSTSEIVNYIINYYYYSLYGVDYLGLINED